MMTLTPDDLARWQAIRKDGRVTVVWRTSEYDLKCGRCGHETGGLAGAPMIEHWKHVHALEWSEAGREDGAAI